jgi:diaminopimelate decarboxylase
MTVTGRNEAVGERSSGAELSAPLPDRVRAAILGTRRPRCVYVYDRTVLRERAQRLRAALPVGSTLLYAVKANGNPDLLDALAGVVDGFDVASAGEIALARIAKAGWAMVSSEGGVQEIHVSGPAKTDAELALAVEAEAAVNVESALELTRLAVAAETAGVRVSTTLRVNRRDAALPGTHAMTGHATQFGIDEDSLADVLDLAWHHPALRLVGFSLHAASNNLDAAAHARFVADSVAWSVSAAERFGVLLRVINVGGGFGVDYATATGGLDLAAFRRDMAGVQVPDGARLIFEPGRAIAADAGWYAAEVMDLKRNHGRWFAVLRGGTHHFRLPAAWGYSHPFTVLPVDDWPHPYARPEVRDVEVDAVGELCTPRDVLTRGQRVDRLRAGDLLVFGRAGAYGWDISHHDFIRHDPPTFVITG